MSRLYLNGFAKAVGKTKEFDGIIKRVYKLTSKKVYGIVNPRGIAVFAYGSPGRIELVGGDSDADILFVESSRTSKSYLMKKTMEKRLGKYDFSKIDMPQWGSFHDLDIYCSKSLVEGNQVLEARAICGDETIIHEVNKKQKGYNTLERQLANSIFNRLYLNQYYRQRDRNGAPNIKYCQGGSREYLFIFWHDILDREISNEPRDDSYRPRIEIALERLYKSNKINKQDYERSINAASFLISLRGDLLSLNKKTSDRGLTILDENAIKRLKSYGYQSVLQKTEESRDAIQKIAKLVWNETIIKGERIRERGWSEIFRKANDSNASPADRLSLPLNDPLIRIAAIWGASESKQEEVFDQLARKYQWANDWITLASIVSSPFCKSHILDSVGRNQAKQAGFGYILRIIARNKNTLLSTLDNIVKDPKLENRYTEIARAALEGGNKSANNHL